jgi:tetratricopeptide (TPR) repeat protein
MAPKLHRRDLKQDEVREKISEAVKSVSLHRREVVYIIMIVVAIALIAVMWFYYEQKQEDQSQYRLGIAMEKLNSPIQQPNKPLDPEAIKPTYTYKSEAEKYRDALKSFEEVIKQYGNTDAADIARYQASVGAFYLKDYKKAEDYLKKSMRVSDRNILYYLSRMTLAEVYSATGKPDQAIPLLKEAIEKNRNIVPPENLMLELAQIYNDAGRTKEAKETYQKIVNEYKDSPVAFQAQNRLDELK